MIERTRREMLAASGMAFAGIVVPASGAARPTLAIPPGVQLWTVKDELARDFAGTLRQLRRIGYARVEAAGWAGRSPAEFRRGVADAGLRCTSCHFGLRELIDAPDTLLAQARTVGARYVVASSPAPSRPIPSARSWSHSLAQAMTLADWRANARAMNVLGARAKAMGMRFGYHNHAAEFLDYDGVDAFGELVRLTDPALVTFELDIGWVAAAGHDPANILRRYPGRVALLHVKDIGTPARTPGRIADELTTTPIGAGTIDWRAVFAAADAVGINGWFVEQEPPVLGGSLVSLRQSLRFLERLAVPRRSPA